MTLENLPHGPAEKENTAPLAHVSDITPAYNARLIGFNSIFPRQAPEVCDVEDVELEDYAATEASFDGASAMGEDHTESMDDLHSRFAKVLGSKASSTGFVLQAFNIPKDFRMQFDHLNGTHAVQQALFDKQQKERNDMKKGLKKRRESTTSKASFKGSSGRSGIKPGFDPVQIVQRRAIGFGKNTTARASTITSDIHALFRPENFHGCPDVIYNQLKPALRLATLFLTHRSISAYWHTLWFGRRTRCEEMSRKRGHSCFRLQEDLPWTSAHAKSFETVLQQYAERVHFYFNPAPLKQRPCIASMEMIVDTKNLLPLHHAHDSDTFMRGKICLHTDFYTVAKRHSLLKHPDPAAVLRYHFWLATCICHEMAHLLEWNRRTTIIDHHHEEVFWYEDTWNEAGEAWERKTFGGRVEPVASRADCMYGIATIDWPLARTNQGSTTDDASIEERRNIYYTLPMEFISTIQQQKTWDLLVSTQSDSTSSNADPFHIPRIGTRSQELLGLDLTVWEDEAERGLISDELDDVNTKLKRTFDGRIVKRGRNARRKGLAVKRKMVSQPKLPNHGGGSKKLKADTQKSILENKVKLGERKAKREAKVKMTPKGKRARKKSKGALSPEKAPASPEKTDGMEE